MEHVLEAAQNLVQTQKHVELVEAMEGLDLSKDFLQFSKLVLTVEVKEKLLEAHAKIVVGLEHRKEKDIINSNSKV